MITTEVLWKEGFPLFLSLFFAAVYFFLFLVDRKDFSSLAMLAFCFSVGWRNALEGDLFSEWFPNVSEATKFYLRQNIVAGIGGVSFMFYISYIVKFPQKLLYGFYFFSGLVATWVFFVPNNRLPGDINRIFLVILVLFGFYKMVQNIRLKNEKAYESKVFLASMGALLVYSLGYIFPTLDPAIIFNIFIVLFYFSQAFLLSMRFRKKKPN